MEFHLYCSPKPATPLGLRKARSRARGTVRKSTHHTKLSDNAVEGDGSSRDTGHQSCQAGKRAAPGLSRKLLRRTRIKIRTAVIMVVMVIVMMMMVGQ